MHINIPSRMLSKMTEAELKNINRNPQNVRNREVLEVDLLQLDDEHITRLREALERLKSERMTRIDPLIVDIDRWRTISTDGANGQERPRTLRQFADLAVQYIMTSDGRRVFEHQHDSNEWLAYYVNEVEYESGHNARNSYQPGTTTLNMLYWRMGHQQIHSVIFRHPDTDGFTIAQALANKGITIETKDLRDQYLEAKDRFDNVFPQVGKQYTTTGYGIQMDRSFGRDRTNLMLEGTPAKVVIDVMADDGDRNQYDQGHVRPYFWAGKKPKANQQTDSDELAANQALLDNRPVEPEDHEPEIPFHPFVPVYHLFRHQRFQVNVMELDEYIFNRKLGDQLVLPQVTKNLVDVLVSQGKVSFQDIIDGKGSGACILLSGPPGVGKTLTAEVFAEATERPLLSVQAAQLGTSPDNIEKQLYQVLRLGSRWNAVVLLDEADVYIDERGGNIQQNAIVAAFLRVLENHTATIFMTTNRINNVDDAIASRCLARIDYTKPSPNDQQQIWKVLNDMNDTRLSGDQINQIVEKHDDLSGRDIKQLLKLAALWSKGQNQPITPDTINFVISFLPTRVAKADRPIAHAGITEN